jgi:hypothetical protein
MGLSKDRPFIVQAAESVSQAFSAERLRPASAAFRDGKAIPIRDPSSWFLTTSTVCSSTTLRPFSGRCRSWGSPRFVPLRDGIPRDAPTALRSFPSADSYTGAETNLRICVGPRHRLSIVSDRAVHREPCPLVLALFAAACGFPPRAAMEAGPRGLAPSSGPLLARPFQAVRARCSLGLVRSVLPPSCSPPPHRER